MQKPENSYLAPDQLRIGLYVHLDLKWFEHPLPSIISRSRTKSRSGSSAVSGFRKIRYDPARSDMKPPPPSRPQKPAEAEEPQPVLTEHPALAAKRALIEKSSCSGKHRPAIESAFVDTAKTIHSVEKNLLTNPEATVEQAGKLVRRRSPIRS